jgi:hypothetical protein
MALISELSHGMTSQMRQVDPHGAIDSTIEQIADWLIENVDMLPKGSVNLSKVLAAMKPKP